MKFQNWLIVALALSATFALQAQTEPRVFRVSMDTSQIQGSPGFIVFDFIDGDGQQNNTVAVGDFSTDAVIGTLSVSGDVSGDVIGDALVLADGEFFNSALQSVVFGESVNFEIALGTATPAGPAPDSFSLFVLDSDQVPAPTNDPTGAAALLVIDLTGPEPDPQVFLSDFVQVSIDDGAFELVGVEADPSSLWPPNDKMIPVQLSVETEGATLPDSACTVSRVDANEPLADDDVQITGPLSLELRARRTGTSREGRIYAVEVTCVARGSEASAVVEVRVPHDQRP